MPLAVLSLTIACRPLIALVWVVVAANRAGGTCGNQLGILRATHLSQACRCSEAAVSAQAEGTSPG